MQKRNSRDQKVHLFVGGWRLCCWLVLFLCFPRSCGTPVPEVPWPALQTGPAGPPSEPGCVLTMAPLVEQPRFANVSASLLAVAVCEGTPEPAFGAVELLPDIWCLSWEGVTVCEWNPVKSLLLIQLLHFLNILGSPLSLLRKCSGFLAHWFNWFRDKDPPPKHMFKARFCRKQRLKVARKGWVHRLHERLRLLSMRKVGESTRHLPLNTVLNAPCSFFADPSEDLLGVNWDDCRGGAGASAATARKRQEHERDHALLEGLAALLAQFDDRAPQSGKKGTKGSGGPRKGGKNTAGKGSPQAQSKESVGLLGALTRLVNRAHKQPDTLLDRLKALVSAASEGKNLEPDKRRPKKPGAKTSGAKGKGGKAPAPRGKNAAKAKVATQAAHVGKGPAAFTTEDSTWVHIVRGTKLAGSASGPVFRLRPDDWTDFTVIPHVNAFGSLIDTVGKQKPFVLLVGSQEQLDEVATLVAGDPAIKASVIYVLGFGSPLEHDRDSVLQNRETKLPLLDKARKVSTRKVQCWSNHEQVCSTKVRVVVPMDKRPPVTTRESSKKDTLVIRLSLDKRFTEPSHWNKARQNPGALARAWMKEAAPVCGQFLQDTWGWELVPGAGGQDSVIKGLVRVKQKDQLTHLLAASGKLIQNVRFTAEITLMLTTASFWLRSAFSRLLGKSLKEPSSEMKNASPSAQDL